MANNAIAKTGTSELATILGIPDEALDARPDFIPEGDKTGTEGITNEDIRLPRLGIAQGLSPQMTPGETQYLENLKLFQMFNDATGEIYANGPIFFVIVRRDVRCIEFRPRSEGGGVVDMNVPRTDPRVTEWRVVDGKRIPPAATLFNEYVVLILKKSTTSDEIMTEPIVISVKNTNKFNRRAATDLNGFIKMHASRGIQSVPIYGIIYSIKSKSEKNDNGTFGVPVFKYESQIPNNQAGSDLFLRAAEYAQSLEGKEITIDRTGDAPIDAEFAD